MSGARQTGVVAVELAIVLIPLTMLLCGITELGRAFYQYDTIVKSTRSAARYLSVQTTGVGVPQAKCLVVAGTINPDACAPPLVSGLTGGMVTVHYIDGVSTCPPGVVTGCGAINLVEVCVNCVDATEKLQFVSVAKLFVPDIAFGEIRAVMRRGGA